MKMSFLRSLPYAITPHVIMQLKGRTAWSHCMPACLQSYSQVVQIPANDIFHLQIFWPCSTLISMQLHKVFSSGCNSFNLKMHILHESASMVNGSSFKLCCINVWKPVSTSWRLWEFHRTPGSAPSMHWNSDVYYICSAGHNMLQHVM